MFGKEVTGSGVRKRRSCFIERERCKKWKDPTGEVKRSEGKESRDMKEYMRFQEVAATGR